MTVLHSHRRRLTHIAISAVARTASETAPVALDAEVTAIGAVLSGSSRFAGVRANWLLLRSHSKTTSPLLLIRTPPQFHAPGSGHGVTHRPRIGILHFRGSVRVLLLEFSPRAEGREDLKSAAKHYCLQLPT